MACRFAEATPKKQHTKSQGEQWLDWAFHDASVPDGRSLFIAKPDVRELWSDDSRVIVGNDARSGWQRVELRDAVSLRDATVRELQAWTNWDNNITLTLNTGGLPAGTHDLYLVVIDGVDAQGWDVVMHSRAIRVVV